MKIFCRHRSYGFTLLEMLVAMAMIAVLAGSLYASLNIGFQAKKHSEMALAPVRAASIAFNMISRDLVCALPPRGILAGPFLGETNSMSFFTRSMSTADVSPGIVAVEYFLLLPDENGNGSVLVRNITANLLSLEQTEPLEEKLSYGVNSLNITYFDGIAWFDVWDSTTMGDVLPVAVEISMEMNVPLNSAGEEKVHIFRRFFLLPCSAPAPKEIVVESGSIE